MKKNKWILYSTLMISVFFMSCRPDHNQSTHNGGEHTKHKSESHHDDHEQHEEHGRHEHHAPHGGTLIVFGEEFAHLEMVHDNKKGELAGYILDGEAEKSVRVQQKEIKMHIELGKENKFNLSLKASSNELTGETIGNTSEFRGQLDKLKEIHQFKGLINAITIRGKAFKNIQFQFPEGNETASGAITPCCDYPILPVLIKLKINPNQILAHVESDGSYWLGDILRIPGLEKLPGKNWSKKYQDAARKHLEKSFKLKLDDQPIHFSSFNYRFTQDLFDRTQSKMRFDLTYDVNTTNGKVLSGQSEFFATYKKKYDNTDWNKVKWKSSLPKIFLTKLSVHGKNTKTYDLSFENSAFQIPLENNIRSETQVALDKFVSKTTGLVKSPPILLLILITVIYIIRRKFYGRHKI